jgi:hypothetical protein
MASRRERGELSRARGQSGWVDDGGSCCMPTGITTRRSRRVLPGTVKMLRPAAIVPRFPGAERVSDGVAECDWRQEEAHETAPCSLASSLTCAPWHLPATPLTCGLPQGT